MQRSRGESDDLSLEDARRQRPRATRFQTVTAVQADAPNRMVEPAVKRWGSATDASSKRGVIDPKVNQALDDSENKRGRDAEH